MVPSVSPSSSIIDDKDKPDDRLPAEGVRAESVRRLHLSHDYPSVLWSVYE
jgi:hypothetical protein